MTPIEQACAEADRDGRRVVVVDFFTTWCGPCRQLDQVTWPDPAVSAWLKAEAVFLKVDGEKDEALTKAFRVSAFPTILLLRPDGTELDRLVGYRTAPAFLSDAKSALAGEDSLTRARKAVAAGKPNPAAARYILAKELLGKGLAAEALEEYLWVFDHALEYDLAMAGVRLSFLLLDVQLIAQTLPAALEALGQRRDRAEERVRADPGAVQDAQDAACLHRVLDEPHRTVALFDQVKDGSARRFLAEEALDLLLADGRFADLLAGLGDLGAVDRAIQRYKTVLEKRPGDAKLIGHMRGCIARLGGKLAKALTGAGREAEAKALSERLAEFAR